MLELLERCVDRDEGAAWGELFQLFDTDAAPTVRRIVKRCRLSTIDADEAVLEVFESLYADDGRRLRTFSGSYDQFAGWLCRVATCCTINSLKRDKHRRQREAAMFSAIVRGRSDTAPTEQDIEIWLSEFATVAPAEEVDKIRFFLGTKSFDPPPSLRTQRRWIKELIEKYPNAFRSR